MGKRTRYGGLVDPGNWLHRSEKPIFLKVNEDGSYGSGLRARKKSRKNSRKCKRRGGFIGLMPILPALSALSALFGSGAKKRRRTRRGGKLMPGANPVGSYVMPWKNQPFGALSNNVLKNRHFKGRFAAGPVALNRSFIV